MHFCFQLCLLLQIKQFILLFLPTSFCQCLCHKYAPKVDIFFTQEAERITFQTPQLSCTLADATQSIQYFLQQDSVSDDTGSLQIVLWSAVCMKWRTKVAGWLANTNYERKSYYISIGHKNMITCPLWQISLFSVLVCCVKFMQQPHFSSPAP